MNKAYVDSRDSNYLPLSGGTVNGTLCANDYRCRKEDGRHYTVFTACYEDQKFDEGDGPYIGLGSSTNGDVYGDVIDLFAYYNKKCNPADGRFSGTGLFVAADKDNHKLSLFYRNGTEERQLPRAINGTYADEDGNVTLDAKSLTDVLKTLYPIGSIYIGTMNVCPLATLFGTWTKIEGRYLLASGTLVGTNETYVAGNVVGAGLPNITGELRDNSTSYTSESFGETHFGSCSISGCVEAFTKTQNPTLDGSELSEMICGFKIDASKSNDIYGGSATVRPPSYCVNVWRRDS